MSALIANAASAASWKPERDQLLLARVRRDVAYGVNARNAALEFLGLGVHIVLALRSSPRSAIGRVRRQTEEHRPGDRPAPATTTLRRALRSVFTHSFRSVQPHHVADRDLSLSRRRQLPVFRDQRQRQHGLLRCGGSASSTSRAAQVRLPGRTPTRRRRALLDPCRGIVHGSFS